MSLDWHWVFPVAGNPLHWKPSEIVSIEHFIGLRAEAKTSPQRQSGAERRRGLSSCLCLGVCVALYVTDHEVGFLLQSLSKNETHVVKSQIIAHARKSSRASLSKNPNPKG